MMPELLNMFGDNLQGFQDFQHLQPSLTPLGLTDVMLPETEQFLPIGDTQVYGLTNGPQETVPFNTFNASPCDVFPWLECYKRNHPEEQPVDHIGNAPQQMYHLMNDPRLNSNVNAPQQMYHLMNDPRLNSNVNAPGTGIGITDQPRGGKPMSSNFAPYFQEAQGITNLPMNLLMSVARAESDFRMLPPNRAGATGVMQVIPGTFAEVKRKYGQQYGLTDINDPRSNILAGALYLRDQYRATDPSYDLMLARYNAGPGAVQKYGGVPPYRETQNYIARINRYMQGGN